MTESTASGSDNELVQGPSISVGSDYDGGHSESSNSSENLSDRFPYQQWSASSELDTDGPNLAIPPHSGVRAANSSEEELASSSSASGEDTEYEEVSDMDDQNDPLGIRRGGLKTLAREWILHQLGRVCSDSVSNDYFDFAIEYADVFMSLKMKRRTSPISLRDIRKRVMKSNLPEARMDFIFDDLSKDEEERAASPIVAYNCLSYPKAKYPTDKFKLVSQVTRVKVIC